MTDNGAVEIAKIISTLLNLNSLSLSFADYRQEYQTQL